MAKYLEIYAIPRADGGYTLFSTPDALDALEADSPDRLRQFTEWFAQRPNRVLAWFGRMLRSVHEYYVKLEDRIDPVERVLKAMASTTRFVVYARERAEFEGALKRQRWKHVFWFTVDFIITPFTLLLVPIPGPNLFLYYPFLRMLSHYRAIRGALSALKSKDIEFKGLPELSGLEDNLPGLARFLERMD
jgi:hypothetical protein